MARQPHLRVWLYVAIPAADEQKTYPRTAIERTKRIIRRALNVVCLSLRLSTSIDFDAWRRLQQSNKGDSLIRDTIKSKLAKALGPKNISFNELEWGRLSIDFAKNTNATYSLLPAEDIFSSTKTEYSNPEFTPILPPFKQ